VFFFNLLDFVIFVSDDNGLGNVAMKSSVFELVNTRSEFPNICALVKELLLKRCYAFQQRFYDDLKIFAIAFRVTMIV